MKSSTRQQQTKKAQNAGFTPVKVAKRRGADWRPSHKAKDEGGVSQEGFDRMVSEPGQPAQPGPTEADEARVQEVGKQKFAPLDAEALTEVTQNAGQPEREPRYDDVGEIVNNEESLPSHPEALGLSESTRRSAAPADLEPAVDLEEDGDFEETEEEEELDESPRSKP